MIDLTICSVSFHNAAHLILNWELTKRLNPDADRCRWLIAENTPEGAEGRLRSADARFEQIPGADPRLVPNYQHTEALHDCLERADSRFVLILDPDSYILRSPSICSGHVPCQSLWPGKNSAASSQVNLSRRPSAGG